MDETSVSDVLLLIPLMELSESVTIFIAGWLSEAHSSFASMNSLANRFFDYIHSAVPQVAMNYPEYRSFNEQFEVAVLIDDLEPDTIATAINRLLTDEALYQRLVENCQRARQAFNCFGVMRCIFRHAERSNCPFSLLPSKSAVRSRKRSKFKCIWRSISNS